MGAVQAVPVLESPLTIVAVVPAHQAAADLGDCLDALAIAGFAQEDVLVVDDGSRDATGSIALGAGVALLRNAMAQGAARARNRGAEAVQADVILFVDADVLVHADVRRRLLGHFAKDLRLAAVIGSYDDRPPGGSITSRYRNLLHHFVHQRSRPEAGTFWTGLGAVRRADFLRLGGFHTEWEKIEDVEFGVRLRRAGGRILLDRDLQGTHLKGWSLGSMFRTDLLGRAVPWSRLVLFHGGPSDSLNLTVSHRVSVISVGLFGLGLAGTFFEPWLGLLSLAALVAFVLANLAFLGFLAGREGPVFALAALPCHALHYLAGGLGYGWVLATEGPLHVVRRRRNGT